MSKYQDEDFSPEEVSRLISEEIAWQQEQWKKELFEQIYGGDNPWTTKS